MKWRVLATATLIAATSAIVANAQDPQADPLYKLDKRWREPIESLIDSAKNNGLPAQSIRLKALMGITAHADGAKILAAVRQHYGKLVDAKTILGASTATDIESGAAALQAGLRTEDLKLFRSTPARSPSIALVYLTDLIQKQGVPRDDLVQAFAKLWKDGARDSDFDGLWHGIDQAILDGVAPNAALQNGLKSIPRPIKPPAEQDEGTPQS